MTHRELFEVSYALGLTLAIGGLAFLAFAGLLYLLVRRGNSNLRKARHRFVIAGVILLVVGGLWAWNALQGIKAFSSERIGSVPAAALRPPRSFITVKQV